MEREHKVKPRGHIDIWLYPYGSPAARVVVGNQAAPRGGPAVMMFVNHCSSCERDQLVFPSMFTAVAQGAEGPEITYTCWCGAEQTRAPQVRAAGPTGHRLAA
jgi:hypothetical protein